MNKRKLFSSIFIALLSLACLCVGVYAAIKASQNVSASVNFNPNGVFVEMSGQIYRGERRDTLYPVYEDSTYTLKTCRNFRVLDETEDESKEPFYSINTPSWTFNPVKFFPQQRWIQVKLTFKNLGKQNISVIPTADMPSSITTNVDVYEEASDTLLIEPGETKEYRLNLKLKDSVTTTIDNTTFTMPLDIRNTSDIENPASDFTMNTTTTTQLDSINSSYSNPIYTQRVVVVPTSLGAKSTIDGYFNYAFENLTTSTKYLILPDGLESLGSNSISYGKGLIGVGIPSSVTSIGYSAFKSCTSLTSITLPSSVISIDGSVFSGCTSLASINIPEGLKSIDSSTFQSCISLFTLTIPSSVTSIGGSAFQYCDSLTSITIPSSVTSIGGSAFSGCTSLTSITIPSGVASIGAYAFSGCTSLASISIPSSVASLGDAVFYKTPFLNNLLGDLNGLKIVTSNDDLNYKFLLGYNSSVKADITSEMLKGVCVIAGGAFSRCASLTSITIPSSVTNIGGFAFQLCTSLNSISIPSSVTSIGARAFEDCKLLVSITIPSGVTNIEYSTFSDCTSLASITIPSSVISIADYAFYSCTSLTSITIPSGVTSIGSSAFYKCTSLASVYMEGSVPNIYSSSFGYSSNAPYTNSSFKIYVKSTYLSGYKPTSGYSTSGSSKANWYYYYSNNKISTY